MAMKMKAIRSFGFPGANEGKVRRGREFEVRDLNRAKELEANGLAYRVGDPGFSEAKKPGASDAKNEAAEQGPFASAGGETGDRPPATQALEGPAQSSPPDHPRPRRRSTRSRASSRS